MNGIPRTSRKDHGSGFKSAVLKDFCNNLGTKHVFCPVGYHRVCGLVERTIQTIKRKLGTEALSRHYKGLNCVLHTIFDDIRKSKYATLNKSPFEIQIGRKPRTELFLASDTILENNSDQSTLARSLLIPEDRHSLDYSRDRAKVVKTGSNSPDMSRDSSK